MLALKVTVQVLLLVSLFGDLDAQLTCQCTGNTCSSDNDIKCSESNEVCFAAEIRSNKTGLIMRTEKGCKEPSECNSTDNCPRRSADDVCAGFGCCNYTNCTVKYTLGTDFEVPPSSGTIESVMVKSTPAIEPSSPAVEPSSPAVEPSLTAVASSFVAPMSTKPEIAATSSFHAKITIKTMMPTATMSEVKSMTSSQLDVKPTGSKKDMMSSSKKDMMSSSEKMKPSPTGSYAVLETHSLKKEDIPPKDTRPTCGSGQVFSTVVVIAIGLLCTVF